MLFLTEITSGPVGKLKGRVKIKCHNNISSFWCVSVYSVICTGSLNESNR